MSETNINQSAPRDEPALVAYRIHKYPSMPIVPATSQRRWMDRTNERFAYRCLPLLIANQHGWFILNVHKVRVIWNGGAAESALQVTCESGPEGMPCPAISHFGHGVLTWNLNYLFRTPPGFNLWARGPANMWKPGIVPLEGIIETDWSAATFTMNWKMIAANMPVEFLPGEPICMILPVRRGEVETFAPMVRDLERDEPLKKAYEEWAAGRNKFIKDLKQPDSEARQEKWQKDYVQGVGPGGVVAPQHQTKLEVRDFEFPDVPKNPSGPPPDDSSSES
jgi:hypothetical protein